MQSISARIPDDLKETIDEIASDRNRKRGDIVREAIEWYLAEWADYQIALERLKDHTDKIITEQELLTKMDWND